MTGTRRALVTVAVVVAATAAGTVPAAAEAAAKIDTYERFGFIQGPGGGLVLDWGYAPRTARVPSGATVKWTNTSQDEEPHTATLVKAANVPDTIGEVFGCFEGLCGTVIGQHAPEGPEGPLRRLVNVGRTGLNTEGDSRLFLAGESIFATVTAPTGRTLHYLCAFHPWMQAKIRVT
jgi:plastocyanin